MFKIKLSPQSSSFIDSKHTNISVDSSKIIYDGEEYDFSLMPDNSQVEGELPAEGIIKKINGVVHITLHYKYNSSLAEFNQSTDINDYIFDVSDGEVPCPIVWKSEQNLTDLAPIVNATEPVIIEGTEDV